MRGFVLKFDCGNTRYERLLQVFINSWRKNSGFPLDVRRVPPPPKLGPRTEAFYWNHYKLKYWAEAFTCDRLFMDADMLCLQDPAPGFEHVDHIGITSRPGDYPINGGVIFAKHTPEARAFMQQWVETDARMLADASFHMPYYKRYFGMNQSSLGHTLESPLGAHAVQLPCATYNVCDNEWEGWPDGRLIHIKGALRDRVLKQPMPPGMLPLLRQDWFNALTQEWERYAPCS